MPPISSKLSIHTISGILKRILETLLKENAPSPVPLRKQGSSPQTKDKQTGQKDIL